MSAKDRERLKVLHEVRKRQITQVQAAKELGVSSRCVWGGNRKDFREAVYTLSNSRLKCSRQS
jgi:hypothetical protein